MLIALALSSLNVGLSSFGTYRLLLENGLTQAIPAVDQFVAGLPF